VLPDDLEILPEAGIGCVRGLVGEREAHQKVDGDVQGDESVVDERNASRVRLVAHGKEHGPGIVGVAGAALKLI
jgi:hypothetical protein